MLNRVQKNEYIKLLTKGIFWDLDIDKLDYKYNKQDIIERIAVYGTDNDEHIMNILYSPGVIKKCLKHSDCLNEKTIRYFAFILHEKEEHFKCYSRKLVPMTC